MPTSRKPDFQVMRGKASQKFDKYDVGGQWKIKYSQQPDILSPATKKKPVEKKTIVSPAPKAKKIKIYIQVPSNGTIYTITGLRAMDSTVGDIHKWLQSEMPQDFPAGKDIDLAFDGTPLTDPSELLKDIGITNESSLEFVEDGITLWVQIDDDELVDVRIQEDQTIGDLKEILQLDHGVSKTRTRRLSYGGTLLSNSRKTLEEYGIDDQADIVVV